MYCHSRHALTIRCSGIVLLVNNDMVSCIGITQRVLNSLSRVPELEAHILTQPSRPPLTIEGLDARPVETCVMHVMLECAFAWSVRVCTVIGIRFARLSEFCKSRSTRSPADVVADKVISSLLLFKHSRFKMYVPGTWLRFEKQISRRFFIVMDKVRLRLLSALTSFYNALRVEHFWYGWYRIEKSQFGHLSCLVIAVASNWV